MMILWALLLYYGCCQLDEQYCKQNCESCDLTSTQCNACSKGYQLSIGGQCIPQSTIPNCELYGFRNICIVCKPTFRLLNNQCQRMYDGCLISGPSGLCNKCFSGAYRNKYGKCDISTLNCAHQGENDLCEVCAEGYKLTPSLKCINDDSGCLSIEKQTGLCLECSSELILFQYRCLNQSKIIENCEVMSMDFSKCIDCKSGYKAYYGSCYSENLLTYMLYGGKPSQICKQQEYYSKETKACVPEPYLCDKFDYGLLVCASCLSINILLDGICRDPSLRFCREYGTDLYRCRECQQNYFISDDGLCLAYPPFCQQVVDGRCIKCISSFLLNAEGNCQDPNCENFNSVTNECQVCRFSYFRNEKGICLFKDLNCLQWNHNVCVKCRINYVLDSQTQICRFVDPDCKVFSQQKVCLQCRQGYYMNINTNLCMQLPPFCLKANDRGQCQLCVDGYALLATYQCLPVSNLSNCMVQSNKTYCQQCNHGYYVENGLCKELPLLCLQYDEHSKRCQKCDENARLKGGQCYDNNCEVFGVEGQCLGCKQNYQFGSKGECVPQVNDPNCKQFQYGQCKKCSDRHYFNKFWKCVKVSSLCKGYNPNNGRCTSCYPGYSVIKGFCIRSSDKNVCIRKEGDKCLQCANGYFLRNNQCFQEINGCVELDEDSTSCVKCQEGFILESTLGICLPENQNSDSNCLASDDEGRCEKCIVRMYVDKETGLCNPINQNCRNYTEDGTCTVCYEGYSVNTLTNECVLTQIKDANCRVQRPDQCEECYEGFYYSQLQDKCVTFDPLCKTSNKTNGQCLSCWGGYELYKGQCLLSSEKEQKQQTNCKQSTTSEGKTLCTECYDGFLLSEGKCSSKDDLNCIQFDDKNEKCVRCAFGAVFDTALKRCEYPSYGEDQKCSEYQNRICVRCEPYHILFSFKCKPLDTNCIQYDFVTFTCLQCKGDLQPKELECV